MTTPVFDEYEVLYDWDAEKEEDLALFAGEFVEVIEKHDHGWWLGMIQRDGQVFRGYFPKNYIKEKPRPRNAPKPPPRPISLPPPPVTTAASTEKIPENVEKATTKVTNDLADLKVLEHPPTASLRVNRGPSFSLRSISAFDDLMSKGYAIEIKDKDKPARGAAAAAGSLVEMNVHAMIWDGASTFTKTFANGVVKFIVGKHSIVPGLQAAAQSIGVGQSATVTCSPKMAYGAAGNPPYVPPNSFIVFEVQLVNVSVPTDPKMAVEAPAELLSEGVPTVRTYTSTAPKTRQSSLILLVPPDVKKDNHGYEISDEPQK